MRYISICFTNVEFLFLFYFIKAWIAGVIVSAPVGPLAILCIRNTLERGFFAGLSIGIGISLADTLLITVSGFGVYSLADLMLKHQLILKLCASLFIFTLGIKEIKRQIHITSQTENAPQKNLVILSIKAFFLTLINPMVLFLFGGIFASIAPDHMTFLESLSIITGLGFGSFCWWISLTFIAKKTRGHLSQKFILRAQKTSGYMLIIIGIYGLSSLILSQLNIF